MDLGKISIEPRLRNGWQAIDLGFAMVRQWWWPAFLAWAVPAFALYLVLTLLFPERAWLMLFLVWWLKPLWDRLPLAMASRALFGEAPALKRTLRDSLKTFKTDALASLTWRRFSPSRSFDLPVTVLEGLRGVDRSRRLSVLHYSYGNAAVWLTLLLVHVEMFLTLGIWSALALLIPEELDINVLGIMLSEGDLATHLSNLIAFTAMALVGPFYSIAGFALYICRRIELEGWDIEIRFRHLAERHRKTGRARSGIAASWMLTILVGGFAAGQSTPNWAQETDTADPAFVEDYYQKLEQFPEASAAKGQVVDILGGEDFHRVEVISGWRFKNATENPDEVPNWFLSLADFVEWLADLAAPLQSVFAGFAGGFEILVWALIITLVVWLIYRYREGLLSAFGVVQERKKSRPPEILFGLDVRKESLPEDVCAQVQSWWREGRHREAVGLLYRATLSRLIHQFSFEFSAGYTEQECVTVVERSNNRALSNYLLRLTRSWQQLAYAHRLPASSQVNELCSEWRDLFRESSSHAL